MEVKHHKPSISKKKWEIAGLASVSFFSEEYRANKDVMAEQSKLSDWTGSGPHHREHGPKSPFSSSPARKTKQHLFSEPQTSISFLPSVIAFRLPTFQL